MGDCKLLRLDGDAPSLSRCYPLLMELLMTSLVYGLAKTQLCVYTRARAIYAPAALEEANVRSIRDNPRFASIGRRYPGNNERTMSPLSCEELRPSNINRAETNYSSK